VYQKVNDPPVKITPFSDQGSQDSNMGTNAWCDPKGLSDTSPAIRTVDCAFVLLKRQQRSRRSVPQPLVCPSTQRATRHAWSRTRLIHTTCSHHDDLKIRPALERGCCHGPSLECRSHRSIRRRRPGPSTTVPRLRTRSVISFLVLPNDTPKTS
jgi:hypothetical protein